MSEYVDIKPAPQEIGVHLQWDGAPPIWFAEEHHALAYAEVMYPNSIVRIFASEQIIIRTIQPQDVPRPRRVQ